MPYSKYIKPFIPSILVAASNAPQWVKNMTSYVCTGSSGNMVDDITINSAFSNSGGMNVVLSVGSFYANNLITVPKGTFEGKGQDYFGTGTNLILGQNGQVVVSTGTTLQKMRITQANNTILPAVTNVLQARNFAIQDIIIVGGNSTRTGTDPFSGVWAMEITDHYEAFISNIHIHTNSNGLHMPFVGKNPDGSSAPFNTGDSIVQFVRVRLQSANSLCYFVGNLNSNPNFVNDISFIKCYGTAGDIPTYSTSNMSGIYLSYAKRIDFYGCNFEETVTALYMINSLNIFINSPALFSDNVTIDVGCTNISFTNTQIGTTLTGDATSLSNVKFLGYCRINGQVVANRGTRQMTSGTYTTTVTHNLGRTPNIQDIVVTANNAAAAALPFYVSNVTATTFDIDTGTAPTSTANFSWVILSN